MTYTHSITSKGQITLPKEFRDKLGLDKVGRATISLNANNEIVLTAPLTLQQVRAMLRQPAGAELLSDAEHIVVPQLVKKYDTR